MIKVFIMQTLLSLNFFIHNTVGILRLMHMLLRIRDHFQGLFMVIPYLVLCPEWRVILKWFCQNQCSELGQYT